MSPWVDTSVFTINILISVAVKSLLKMNCINKNIIFLLTQCQLNFLNGLFTQNHYVWSSIFNISVRLTVEERFNADLSETLHES